MLGKGVHAGFGSMIGSMAGKRMEPGYRAEIDNMPEVTRHHPGQHDLAELQNCEKINVDDVVEVLAACCSD